MGDSPLSNCPIGYSLVNPSYFEEVIKVAIKWSVVQVSEAMDMVEGFIRDADLPLSQASIVANEARRIAYLRECCGQGTEQHSVL